MTHAEIEAEFERIWVVEIRPYLDRESELAKVVARWAFMLGYSRGLQKLAKLYANQQETERGN